MQIANGIEQVDQVLLSDFFGEKVGLVFVAERPQTETPFGKQDAISAKVLHLKDGQVVVAGTTLVFQDLKNSVRRMPVAGLLEKKPQEQRPDRTYLTVTPIPADEFKMLAAAIEAEVETA